jgi:Leucine-rich repeat (LRR) protein
MSALTVAAFGIEVPRGSPAHMFPFAPIEHFLKHNVDLLVLHFEGTGNAAFPVCAVPSSVGSVTILGTLEFDVACVLRWTRLTILHLQHNELKTIDVSPLTQLTYLHLGGNELKTIDVSPLTQLTSLHLYGNELKTIDVSPLTQLTHLSLYGNQLKTIDVSPLTELRFLRLDGNRFNTSAPTAGIISVPRT